MPVGKGIGIDKGTKADMQKWIQSYRGRVRLAISETHAAGIPVCEPFKKETGMRAYAHINANGILKRNSFSQDGVLIEGNRVMDALQALREKNEGGSA